MFPRPVTQTHVPTHTRGPPAHSRKHVGKLTLCAPMRITLTHGGTCMSLCLCPPHPTICSFTNLCLQPRATSTSAVSLRGAGTGALRKVPKHTGSLRNTHRHGDGSPPLPRTRKHSPAAGDQHQTPACDLYLPSSPCAGAPAQLAPTRRGLTRVSWERAGPKHGDNSVPGGAREEDWRGGLHI